MFYPLLFENNLHELVWGGHRLMGMKGLDTLEGHKANEVCIGESWEISAVAGSESVVLNGEMAGRRLSEVVALWGSDLVGKRAGGKTDFPLLVKFIDAASDLSIQVHPNDALAQARHGKLGKTEMWYVIDAEPGATLLAGFREEIQREEYAARVADGSIVDVLARHEVKAGDVFFIPAGRVHAICGGILLCEIQQSSDVTYRLYDYNRVGLDGKPRELHTELAQDAIDYHVYPNYRTAYTPTDEGVVRIVDCDFFVVSMVATRGSRHRDLKAQDSFVTLSCLEGACTVRCVGGEEVSMRQGFSCLVPAAVADYEVTALDGHGVKLLESYTV